LALAGPRRGGKSGGRGVVARVVARAWWQAWPGRVVVSQTFFITSDRRWAKARIRKFHHFDKQT